MEPDVPPIRFRSTQRIIALVLGIAFGFLLHQGGATHYDVLMGQLLLEDFTVLKVFLSAMVTAAVLLSIVLRAPGVQEHRKSGSWGQTAVGGLIFGMGFALLGYCPGTVAGAIGHGSMDALLFGITGAVVGSYLFALCYPWVRDHLWSKGPFADVTIPELLHVPRALGLVIAVAVVSAIIVAIEYAGY